MNQVPSCSAIDTGFFITTSGGVKTCCSGQYDLGSIRSQSVIEIFDSEKYIDVRNALVNHQSADYCKQCDRQESIALGSSQKTIFNQSLPSVGQRKIKQIDIRWSNLCNLACRYCNPHDSSEWAKLHNIPIESLNRSYIQSVFDTVSENLDYLEEVYLLGGEPLLQKHNETLLDLISGKQKILVVTNLSVNLEKNNVYQKLKKFQNISWSLSFENVGDKFEYVRHGANWQKFLNNIQILRDDFGTGKIDFHPVYSVWSAVALDEFYDFAHTFGDFKITWQLCNDAFQSGYDIFTHNEKIKSEAIRQIEKTNVGSSANFFSKVKDKLQTSEGVPQQNQKFLNWIAESETLLSPNKTFAELWPNLYRLLSE
jgi:sulfatase maturation enzyme AslB (radical SAM superfamily)